MRPSGAHVHGHGSPVEVIGALAAVAVMVAVLAFIAQHLWQILATVAVLVAGALYVGWRWHVKYGRAPEVLPWVQRQAVAAQRPIPIAARPVQALPAPQIQINNFYVTTPEQAAELAARREIEGR